MKKKLILVFITACYTISYVDAQNNATDIWAHSLTTSLKTHNISALDSLLSTDFSVAAYTESVAKSCLNAILNQYNADSASVSQKNKPDNNLLQVAFYKQGKLKDTGSIALDTNQKAQYISVFDKLYGMDRNAHSKLLVRVPFEADEHGSVFLSVRLNNSKRTLRLLFDTGADGLALNKNLADSIGLKITKTQGTSVVGGNMKIDISENNVVHLDSFSISHQNIALFDNTKGNSDGIIGNSLAKLFIVKVDYDKKELLLFNFGDYQQEEHSVKIPVTAPEGIFLIPGTLNVTEDKPYNGKFVFDLGAAYSLICFRPFVKHNRLLVDGFKPLYQGATVSMGMSTPTFSGNAASFQFRNMPPIKNMIVTLMSGGGQSENWNPRFDGSIGTRLISKYNFVINMQYKSIYFSPNKSFSYPDDFVLGKYLFGFDTEGRLRIQSSTSMTKDSSFNNEGAIVKSIEGISSQKIRSNKKNISNLLGITKQNDSIVLKVSRKVCNKKTD